MGMKIIAGNFRNMHMIHPAKRGVNVPRKNILVRGMNYYETVAIERLDIVAQTKKTQKSGGAKGPFLGLLLWPILGPVGILLGLASGKSKSTTTEEITFTCRLVDGRGFTAKGDMAAYQAYLAAFHRQK